jgi:RND family efflux transporter MFP subunit
MSAKSKLLKIGLPFLIIGLAVVATKTMIGGRQGPAKVARIERGALVETMVATKSARLITIHSTGTVQPHQEVTIIPQVSGRVISQSPKLISGGFFKKGETLFSIETIDYELARERARASLAKMEYELSAVESRARIARTEWDIMKNGQSPPANSLVLYGPQLKDAHANLASARAALRQAEIELERTTVTAPFNGVIRSENIDAGQYVKAGTGVLVISGTDSAEVVVPVNLNDLHWLEIPGPGRGKATSSAEILLPTGNRSFIWPGRIARVLAEVDAQGRMARLVVTIQDPYLLKTKGAPGQPALAIGSFVEVAFTGRTMTEIFVLPRQALRDHSTVWVMTADNLLKIRKVTTARLERDEVFISEGLEAGEQVILTNLTGAANGMKLRAAGVGEQI